MKNFLNPFEDNLMPIKVDGLGDNDVALEPCTLSVPDIDDTIYYQHEFYRQNQVKAVGKCIVEYNERKHAIIAEQRKIRNKTRLMVGMAVKPFLTNKPN